MTVPLSLARQVKQLTLPNGTPFADAFERDQWLPVRVIAPILSREVDGSFTNRELIIQAHRGLGKTSVVGGLMLPVLDELPATEIVLVALDTDNAAEGRNAIRGHAHRMPGLSQLFRFGRDDVRHRHNGSSLKVLSSDVSSAYSFGASAQRVVVVVDEFSRWPNRELWDSLYSALGKFENAQLIVLSNAFVRPSWNLDARDALIEGGAYVFRPAGVIASWLDRARLERLRRQLPDRVYLRDYENLDIDAQGEDGLIPSVALAGARKHVPYDDSTEPVVAGIDVAGPGEDETVLTLTTGGRVLKHLVYADADPRGKVTAALQALGKRLAQVNVDSAGLGWNFYLHLRDVFGDLVQPFNVGEAPRGEEDGKPAKELFANLKAQLYWNLRKRFEAGEVSGLTDDVTIAQLASLRYEITPRGVIAIENKDAAKRRGVKSPDRAESLMLALAPSALPVRKRGVFGGWVGLSDPAADESSGIKPLRIVDNRITNSVLKRR